MKKSLFVKLLCVMAAIGLFATGAFTVWASADGDDGILETGNCGEAGASTGVGWAYHESGVLSFFGVGRIAYYNTGAPWAKYKNDVQTVVFADTITNVTQYMFSGYQNLASVTLPANLTEIGGYAFSNCAKLPSLTLPDNVTQLAKDAFSNYYNGRLYATMGSETAKAVSGRGRYFYAPGYDSVQLKYRRRAGHRPQGESPRRQHRLRGRPGGRDEN